MGGWIILGVIVAIAVWLVAVYNGLVTLRQRTKQSFADIDVQLKQRHDLVPNLVETVKGYATHEKGVFEEVTRARAGAMSAQGPAQQGAAEGILSAALGRLFAVAEAYPDLKANQNFLQLQNQLDDLENKIAAARRFFNNAVQEYNSKRESVPAAFFAQSMGFLPQEFFDLGTEERAKVTVPPQVKFQ
jgi:LemA protein